MYTVLSILHVCHPQNRFVKPIKGMSWYMLINLVAFNFMDNQVIEVYISATSCRQNGATTNSLARVNSSNVTNADYQPLLMTSITVTGALLASLGGCTVLEMSLGLNVSIMEPGSRGTVKY